MATSKPKIADLKNRNALDPTAILQECCEQSSPCRFQLVHSGYSICGTFLAINERGIELRSPFDEEDGETLRPQAICCVSFPYRTSFCAFLGCLIEADRFNANEVRIVVTPPNELTATNLRQSFRVPVVPQAGLKTIIHINDELKFDVTARDIANDGIEIEFDANDNHNLQVGTEVVVELRFRDEVIQRIAEVRRITGSRCGLVLNQDIDDEAGHRQSASMHGIVLSLQQLWLKNRVT